MTIAELCILIAALLPHITITYAKSLAKGKFDNADPRDKEVFSDRALRAHNAHLNGFEIFPLFAIAVLLAEFRAVPQAWINVLAVVFIVSRLAYICIYPISLHFVLRCSVSDCLQVSRYSFCHYCHKV